MPFPPETFKHENEKLRHAVRLPRGTMSGKLESYSPIGHSHGRGSGDVSLHASLAHVLTLRRLVTLLGVIHLTPRVTENLI